MIAEVFRSYGSVGTFVLLKASDGRTTIFNQERAKLRVVPASTFKIANSLIALETGVVQDADEVVPYGGQPQRFKSWERDMSIRDAIRISNVPVFQEIARRIGISRYEKWLGVLGYGNGIIGGDVEDFWLKGPLKISALEQVSFLRKLAQQKLPVSLRSQSLVADIIRLERSGDRVLYGKTGWSGATNPELGWFVGWVENERGISVFALNMDINTRRDAKKRKQIAKAVLKALDVF